MSKDLITVRAKRPPVVELDSEAHAAYVRFSSNAIRKTEVVTDRTCVVTIDRDKAGEVVGVEFIGVQTFSIGKLLPKAGINLSKKAMQSADYVPTKHLVAA